MSSISKRPFLLIIVTLALGSGVIGQAENIDLVTLPRRNTVQLTIYNSEDLTLAKETRYLTLKKGKNQLQFSWAGTSIDPTSVELRPLEHQDKIEIADTRFPGQKPQHLIWNIESQVEGQVPVEVSYFTSGLTWSMDYVAISNSDETQMQFRGYVRVFNRSGEEYENAQIRLIVGKINLVEKIAQLAKQKGIPTPNAETEKLMRLEAMQKSISRAHMAMGDVAGGAGPAADPKAIVKEGVSEYFMFSVEGTETIPNGWSKRMQAVDADDVSFDIVYRLRTHQYGARPVRFFLWRNDSEHQLGDSPLPNGVIRVFRTNANDGLSFLGNQALEYVPVKAEIEVNLGVDDLVVFRQTRIDTERINFSFHPRNSSVIGWDELQNWNANIRNYRDKPIRFEWRLRLAGDIELTPEKTARSFDFNTIEAQLDVPARGGTDYPYRVVIDHGRNAKQNRVLLKPAQ